MPWITYDLKGNIIEMVFPDGVEVIPDNFLDGNIHRNCGSVFFAPFLKRLIMSDTIREVGEDFGMYCKHTQEVRISKNLKRVGESFLRGNKKLRELVFTDELEEINCYFLNGCEDLIKLRFSVNVKKMSSLTFSGCRSLSIIEPAGVLKRNRLDDLVLASYQEHYPTHDFDVSYHSGVGSIRMKLRNTFLHNTTELQLIQIPNALSTLREGFSRVRCERNPNTLSTLQEGFSRVRCERNPSHEVSKKNHERRTNFQKQCSRAWRGKTHHRKPKNWRP